MGAIEGAELADDVAHVVFYRAFGDAEFVGDFLITPSGSEVGEHIEFTTRKGFGERDGRGTAGLIGR